MKDEIEQDKQRLQFKTFAKATSGGKILMDGVRFVGDLRADKFADAEEKGHISMVGAEFMPTETKRGSRLIIALAVGMFVTVVGGLLVAWVVHAAGWSH